MADRARLRLLVALLLLPAAVGCGGEASPGRAAPPAATPPAATPPTPAQEELVTEDDDGRTIALQVGEQVPWQLGSRWSWASPQVRGAAVRLDPVDHLVDPGYTEWLVVAVEPGTAEVSVDGSPACPDPADCPARTVRLSVTVG